MGWLFLAGAIVSEVFATLGLRLASGGQRTWYVPVALGYLMAFTLLGETLRHGVTLGVAYGVWTAAGVALTALASHVFFAERITPRMASGLVLIMAGVICIELGAAH